MDYRALRALIGAVAFLIVPVVYIGNWLIFTRHVGDCFSPNPRIPGSLSGFYYTHMRNLVLLGVAPRPEPVLHAFERVRPCDAHAVPPGTATGGLP